MYYHLIIINMVRSINHHAYSNIGLRDYNEDTELSFKNLNENGDPIDKKYNAIDFFVICDGHSHSGHSGKKISKFVANELYYSFCVEKKKNILFQIKLYLIFIERFKIK